MINYDQNEIDKFNNLSQEWWDPQGELRTLHHINPVRLQFVKDNIILKNTKLIDVGCGGGIFAELLKRNGANVTGIDLSAKAIEIAKLHLYESHLEINYQCTSVEEMANNNPHHFDVLTCMEMLEHVPNPNIIIANCAKLLKPGGVAFFSTLNRNLKSYVLGILAAEYILKLLPAGTHEYKKFIKPFELRNMLIQNNLELIDIKGLSYNPLTKAANISNDTSINYMVSCRKIEI